MEGEDGVLITAPHFFVCGEIRCVAGKTFYKSMKVEGIDCDFSITEASAIRDFLQSIIDKGV